jgi:hypothetical protein
VLQLIVSAEKAQERISIYAAGKPTTGRGLQLPGHNKVADGFVDCGGKLKEWRVSDCESVSRRPKQDMVEQLCLQRENIAFVQADD